MNLLSLLLGIAAVVFAVLNAVALIRSRSQQTCNHC